MAKVAATRVDGVSFIKDKICDVIYKRNENLIRPLVALFQRISVRKRSCIQDINELFDTLDRLNLGSVHNLWAFIQIADFLKDPELEKLISDVGQLNIPDQHHCFIGRNLYAYRRTNKNLQSVPSTTKSIDDDPLPPPGPSKPTSVPPQTLNPFLIVQNRTFDLLACEIGKRWRDLGRQLNFHEADLDEFEDRHGHNLRERIYGMLQEYARQKGDTEEMLNSICTALDQCRRVDLRKKVQQFLAKRS